MSAPMSTRRHARSLRETSPADDKLAGTPLKPISVVPYLTKPLAKVEGISTELVIGRVGAINDPDSGTQKNAQKFLGYFLQGLLLRSQGTNPPLPDDLAGELKQYITSNITTPQPTPQMLSVLFPRGYVAIEDPNIWTADDPLITKSGAAILAVQWGRITRHEYVNFESQNPSTIAALQLKCDSGDFGSPNNFVADGAKVIADIEALDGTLPAATRWGICGTWDKSSGGVALGGPVANASSVRACVHTGTRFTINVDGALALTSPILLADPAQTIGSILAVDILPDDEVGETKLGTSAIGALRNPGFAVIKAKDVQNNALVTLSATTWPGKAPNKLTSGWLRVASCRAKVITVSSYMAPPLTPTAASASGKNSISMLEQDLEDNVCFVGKIVVSGANETDASLGPASPVVFRVPSSVAPPIPVIRSIISKPWNIEVGWMAKTPDGTPLFDFDTHLQVALECTKLNTSRLSSRDGANLATILGRMIAGGWPDGDGEWATVAAWLGNPTMARAAVGTLPRFSDPPKVFSNPGAGSLLIAPSAQGGSLDWTGQEADILQWRRENYAWRVRLRAVANFDNPDFAIYSDWTLATEPISSLPLVPQFIRALEPVPTVFPRPTIAIFVNYTTRYRQPDEFATLGYQLVVRKYLIVPDPTKKFPGDHDTAPYSERVIIGPFTPEPVGNQYLWRFQFTDREVAPHEKYADKPTYSYELELQQLRISVQPHMPPSVVTKSKVFTVLPPLDPNCTVTIEAAEPDYDQPERAMAKIQVQLVGAADAEGATSTVTLDPSNNTWTATNDNAPNLLANLAGTFVSGTNLYPGFATNGTALIIQNMSPIDTNSIEAFLFGYMPGQTGTGRAQMYKTASVGSWNI